MVFGWGKKKEEKIPEAVPQHKEIQISEVQKITLDLLDLRKTQTVAEIKALRNQTFPLLHEIVNIVKTLEKDDLKSEEIDKHLRIIVTRGKKQVIDVFKKDSSELPEISSFDDAVEMSNVLNQKLKKFGDVLGRQTRVIHIFAKKYAQKMKEILEQMNTNNTEIQKLIKNFQDTSSDSNEITELLERIQSLERDSISKNERISEMENSLSLFQNKLEGTEDSINKIKQSDQYSEFLKLNQQMTSFNDTKIHIKNEIDTQFTKISRALGRYEYASSLDKEQKLLLNQLINNPTDAMTLKNKDSIIVIFENVKKGINSGSISVKDTEKSLSHITDTENLLEGFVKKINNFTEQKNEIQNKISNFDKSELTNLEKDLEKTQNNMVDGQSKLSSYKKEIEENKSNIPQIISQIENKLKRFSNTNYHIVEQNQN